MPNREVGINFGSMSKEGYADDSLLFSWFFGWAFSLSFDTVVLPGCS